MSRFFFIFGMLLLASACTPIEPKVVLIGIQNDGTGVTTQYPGLHLEAPTEELTGGGMKLKARITSMGSSPLMGGGMVLRQGMVR